MQQVNLPKQNKPNVSLSKKDTVTIKPQSGSQQTNSNQNSNNTALNPQKSSKDLNNSQNSNNRDNSQQNRRSPGSNRPSRSRPQKDNFSDPWGSAWDDPWDSKPQENEKKLTPQERTEMITKVYMDVLGREPDTRDINYYKYSTLGEDEIYKQILTGKEHKKLIADGKDFKNMNTRASQSEVRVKVLEGQIKDQVVEFRQLTELLQEKNRYINQLRSSTQNPYSFTTNEVNNVRQGHMHYSQNGKVQETRNTQLDKQSNTQLNSQANTQNKKVTTNPTGLSQQQTQLTQNPSTQSQPSQVNPPLHTQQNNSQTSNVQFGNPQVDLSTVPKKNKVKEFLKTVLDL